MADIEITLSVSAGEEVQLRVDGEGDLALGLGEPFISAGAEEYEGPYQVRPSPHGSQVLETRYRLMADDVTVEEIPYYKTTNESGGYTAIIGE